jgi:hypothetical protein
MGIGRLDLCGIRASVLFILSGFLYSGQAMPQRKPQILRYDAAALIKLVTVRVLDRIGRPVKDLKREDFFVLDNGEQKTVTEFEIHDTEQLEAGRPPVLMEPTRPESNRNFFIDFDIQGSDEAGLANAKKAASHFIETELRPGDK